MRTPLVGPARRTPFWLALLVLATAVGTARAAADGDSGHEPSPEFWAANGLVEAGRPEGLLQMRLLADGGDIDAQFFLGNLFFFPEYGMQDFEQAFLWYSEAAGGGHVEAAHNIGVMYARGAHVEADQEEAVRWFRKAAQAGSASAQSDLAGRYYHGRGVVQDLGLARYWYQKAAAQGHVGAAHNLKVLIAHGKRGARPQEEIELRDAAAAGDVEAQWKLYEIFSARKGPPGHEGPNRERARHWLVQAARNRHPEAVRLIIRSGFFQGCDLGCQLRTTPRSQCTETCQCVMDRFEERFSPNEIADRIDAITSEGDVDALIELIETAQPCGGVPI